MEQKIIDGYEARVIRRYGDECWSWKGGSHELGYGHVMFNGTVFAAHRIAYERAFGEIPAGLDVMHACHNPECSNPNHLSVGTRKQNMQESRLAGRLQRKIPLGEMPLIFEMRKAGWTLQQIGDLYSCTKQAVRHMIRTRPELANG